MNKNNKLKQQVNEILKKLNPQDFDEPINWGDLHCCEAHFTRKGNIIIHISEAAPDCPDFQQRVASQVYNLYQVGKITVKTEW